MARLPRYVIPGQPQHIIQRGNNRQTLFAAEADYQFFRDALVEAAARHGLTIHAYVWMTNHIHLLATPEFNDSISKTFQSVGRRYVQYFNYTYKRSGTLWEGRYRATVVDSERYLSTLMRYIELNPVRAGMVAVPQDYPWSSYRRNALGESGPNADWLVPHEQYTRLGREDATRQAAYRALFDAAIDREDLAEIRDCTHKGWALGGERFKAEIEALGQRRAVSKGVGRPRKEGGDRG
ncbi:MAG: transposase [Thiobacillus sp.]|jgi:putative transposase|uniref:transposase n=1 Tax=Thiobacillus sp. TaxID=924 RepID=UPI0028957F9E|nr:transposase [Thiobacillus sp.]MDT3705447.1 transposase [Thiobacillus sp.]